MYEGGADPIVPVSVVTEIFDASDVSVFSQTDVMSPERFDASRAAPFQLALPLGQLSSGPYLLNVTIKTASGRSARRDLLFKIR
jgi:hypothetical protein